MTVFKTEKNLSGILSALFFAFTKNVFPDDVKDISSPIFSFTDEYFTITENPVGEKRVENAVILYGGVRTINAAKICLLSCDENALKITFDFLRFTLKTRKCEIENLSEKIVSDFLFAVNKVLFERHRFAGFLRFKETENGVLYAPFSPDNDITALLMPHFIKRLPYRLLVIHDLKRKIVGISDGKTFRILTAESAANPILSETEKECENLFKSYFKSITVKERKNLKQQNNFLPKRYRKNMPETYEY